MKIDLGTVVLVWRMIILQAEISRPLGGLRLGQPGCDVTKNQLFAPHIFPHLPGLDGCFGTGFLGAAQGSVQGVGHAVHGHVHRLHRGHPEHGPDVPKGDVAALPAVCVQHLGVHEAAELPGLLAELLLLNRAEELSHVLLEAREYLF